ncbi:putative peptidylprolyl isomerase [Rosa chinensis]|uniref:peptidylprolyl isomerase n=1 Tax=Rosa chinensis TaxID=74649 RepID=A0A2P6QDD0_ROSCH|nr:putative peptidylprolyl isomerase [Rosa chinensis]
MWVRQVARVQAWGLEAGLGDMLGGGRENQSEIFLYTPPNVILFGDPLGDGTGGQSIWGREFEDEFHKSLRHDRPFSLLLYQWQMLAKTQMDLSSLSPQRLLLGWTTVFGRVIKGMDVVQAIEKVKTNKDDKPHQDVKILNVTVPKS